MLQRYMRAAAQGPNMASKGLSGNVRPNTAHAAASTSADLAPGGGRSGAVKQGDGAIDMQGNEPTKSAWIKNEDSGYRYRQKIDAPDPPSPSISRRPVQQVPSVSRDTSRRGYDFSRVSADSDMAQAL